MTSVRRRLSGLGFDAAGDWYYIIGAKGFWLSLKGGLSERCVTRIRGGEMSWAYLVIAGIFETVWAVALKQSDGLSRLWPSVITAVAMAVSLYFLSLALKALPLGTAYAVWTGIGAVGAALVGIFVLGEVAGPLRIVSIGLVVLGMAGLRLAA